MKKTITLIYAFIMMMTASTVLAQTTGDDPSAKSRRIYCVAMHNPDWDYRYGISVFESGDPTNSMQLLHEFGGGNSIYAGAAANDIYYAYFYYFGNRGPEPVSFSSINLRTGEQKEIADWRGKIEWPKFQDMTYDYTTNTMYAVAFDAGESYLNSIDLATGEMKKVVTFERTLATIAASNEGVLYGIDIKGNLCTINKENGKLTIVVATEHVPSMNQSMEFDRTDGTLYWATAKFQISDPGDDNAYLTKFNLADKTYENLGQMGGLGTQVVGMYIPFLRTGFDVPGAATDLNYVPGKEGAETAIINWKNPLKTFGDDNLLEITSLTVSRDGEVIKTYEDIEDLQLGKAMSFEDNTVKTGEHIYSICATNSAGAGEEAKLDTYIGMDIPATVNNLQITTIAPCKSATLTWEAPTEGAHKGYFDGADLSYTIVRFPDSTVVAKNQKELTFTDETYGRLVGYTYKVSANNKTGESKATATGKVIFGKPLSLPFTCEFDDQSIFDNNWMVYDLNGDPNTFQILSPMGKIYFGDATLLPAVEYLMQDKSVSPYEWLITPPMNFEQGKKYVLTFGVRNIGADQLTVTIGDNNTVEGQATVLKTLAVTSEPVEDEDGKLRVPFKTIAIELEQMTGVHCIGFKLSTPAGNSNIFQIGNIYVGEPTAINNESISEVKVFNSGNKINITGDFGKAEIYNTSGVRVGNIDANQPQMSTSNWTPGIYYVKVMDGNSAKVYKTIIK